ncbi:MAG: CoA pyrophosphatase [Candidatus Lambdaproteobacteria bacterium]|nr:CoA pyrophosphatase [Candidatus Lambdaproteobacteria bacterium]
MTALHASANGAPDLARIRRALAGTADPQAHASGPLAAVALVLAGAPADLHVCLIHRAEHQHDRWSGHVSLPGGRVDPGDPDARSAAIRETREEVGLRLDNAPWLGSLDLLPVSSRGVRTEMSLCPYVFHLGERLEPFSGNDEVAQAYWVPLAHLLDPRNAALRHIVRNGVELTSPAIRFADQMVWGLTYRVLTVFFERMALRIPRPE